MSKLKRTWSRMNEGAKGFSIFAGLAAIVVFLSFLMARACEIKPLADERINDVTRILMHERDRYTLIIKKPESLQLLMREFEMGHGVVKIIADVPDGQMMWAAQKRYQQFGCGSGCCGDLEIHVHSSQDINGGGWNHGKFGRGQTVVIE